MKRTLEQKKKKVGWDKQCSLFLFFLFIVVVVVVVVVVDGVVFENSAIWKTCKVPTIHTLLLFFFYFWITILKFLVQLQNSYSVSEHTAFGSGKQMRFRNAWPTGRVFAGCWMDDASKWRTFFKYWIYSNVCWP